MTVPGTVGNPLYVKDDTTSGPLLVSTSSASKGYQQLTSTAASVTIASLCSGAVLPTGATKVILVPTAAVRVRDDGTPSATVGFPIAASQSFKYDGDTIATLKIYGAATVDAWFYA